MIMLTRYLEMIFNPLRNTGLKSSQIMRIFVIPFGLKRDERRNQTLVQSIVQKMPYICINYLD